jgi:F-type H+-transporting ATPase subunit epsilon
MAEDRDQRGGERQLFCRVITPEEVIYDGEADLVIARIADGDIGVLVDHSPLVSTVEAGEVRIGCSRR